MKVYLLMESIPYEGDTVHGVFASPEKAGEECPDKTLKPAPQSLSDVGSMHGGKVMMLSDDSLWSVEEWEVKK